MRFVIAIFLLLFSVCVSAQELIRFSFRMDKDYRDAPVSFPLDLINYIC